MCAVVWRSISTTRRGRWPGPAPRSDASCRLRFFPAGPSASRRTQVPLLVDRWLAGEIDVESLISHRITLGEVNYGFELMEAQDGIRSVITFP